VRRGQPTVEPGVILAAHVNGLVVAGLRSLLVLARTDNTVVGLTDARGYPR
jgi:hypothetical protein